MKLATHFTSFMEKSKKENAFELFETHRVELLETYSGIVNSKEFYYQKALDTLDQIRSFDSVQNVVVRQGVPSKKENVKYFELLAAEWIKRGNKSPTEFYTFLKREVPFLQEAYELLNTFIAYVNKRGWNRQVWNEYEDKRAIIDVDLKQDRLIDGMIQYVLNDFLLPSGYESTELSIVLSYLDNPAGKFSIVSSQFRDQINTFFGIKVITGDVFNSVHRKTVKTLKLVTENSDNLTCLFQYILLDPLIRRHWDPDFEKPVEEVERGSVDHKFLRANNFNVPDQLDVEHDIQAFASLLAYRDASPPLAIGLFGNWGSGKSYFMNNIEKQIEAMPSSPEICENIVHVKFNSWHYTDANLWASLMTQIFGSLNEFAKRGTKAPDRIESIYGRMAISKKQLGRINAQFDELFVRHEQVAANIYEWCHDEMNPDASFNSKKVMEFLYREPAVEKKVEELGDLLDIDLSELYQDLPGMVKKYEGRYNRVLSTFKMLHDKFGWKLYLSAVLCLGLVILMVLYGPDFVVKLWENDFGNIEWVKNLGGTLGLSGFGYTLSKYYRKISKGFKTLKSLSGSWDNLKEKSTKRVADQISLLKKEHLQVENELQALEEERQGILSGKKLGEFISERANDDRYKENLGIISWIRADFEKLDQMLRVQKAGRLKALESGEEVPNEELGIDRIILYIDDLDRCKEDRVVEVLAAVHLLLTFELFGVVVGVDPRWVTNALNSEYGKMLKIEDWNQKEGGNENENVKNENTDVHLTYRKRATTYDYLEKIFQVPFALLPMEEEGAKRLIASLFEDNEDSKIKLQQRSSDGSSVENPAKLKLKKGEKFSTVTIQNSKTDVPKEIVTGKESTLINQNTPSSSDPPSLTVNLKIDDQEVEYIQHLAKLIGDTPRTIQRFVNVYRIIRAHPKRQLPVEFGLEHKCVIVLLAIVIGAPKEARTIIDLLEKAAKDNSSNKLSTILKNNASDGKVYGFLKASPFDSVMTANCAEFANWSGLVSRFSFRTAEMLS